MNGTHLDPNMCLLGPKKPFGGPKLIKCTLLSELPRIQLSGCELGNTKFQ